MRTRQHRSLHDPAALIAAREWHPANMAHRPGVNLPAASWARLTALVPSDATRCGGATGGKVVPPRAGVMMRSGSSSRRFGRYESP